MVSYSKESETVVSRIDKAQSHLQWLEDRETYRDNRRIDENGMTHCRMRSLRLSLMFSLSQQSGILAGRVANYPKCALLDMHGVTGIVLQCRAVNTSFGVEMTKCGAQPVFQSNDRKYTVGRDGWTMQTFSPCIWSGSMVSFNGVTSQYHDGAWVPMNVTTTMCHYDAMAQYNYTADQSYAFFHGLETQEIQPMNLMGELSGLLCEDSVQVLDDVLQQEKDVNLWNLNLGVFDAIKSAFFVVFCLFLVIVVVYAGHRTGCFKCCGVFCKCCCSLFTREKKLNRPALDYVANQDVVLPLTGTIYTAGSMPPAGAPRRVTLRRS
ncbi:hypothetical protein RvY_01806-2 [Ramazzottius varieornatus]|uniref:Uncharacterized protein n=1 Tax=Ramazzottius varieornatus TaxID=947166 RepID=A0A1D1UL24_RAMVA|nr:hypothetical protein RvY_01806-2 [Ramazzottius varieornatus]